MHLICANYCYISLQIMKMSFKFKPKYYLFIKFGCVTGLWCFSTLFNLHTLYIPKIIAYPGKKICPPTSRILAWYGAYLSIEFFKILYQYWKTEDTSIRGWGQNCPTGLLRLGNCHSLTWWSYTHLASRQKKVCDHQISHWFLAKATSSASAPLILVSYYIGILTGTIWGNAVGKHCIPCRHPAPIHVYVYINVMQLTLKQK